MINNSRLYSIFLQSILIDICTLLLVGLKSSLPVSCVLCSAITALNAGCLRYICKTRNYIPELNVLPRFLMNFKTIYDY